MGVLISTIEIYAAEVRTRQEAAKQSALKAIMLR
jgi:hypothetical protein